MQVVGKLCVGCQRRIAIAGQGVGCESCRGTFHTGCAPGHACVPTEPQPGPPPHAASGTGALRRVALFVGICGALAAMRLVVLLFVGDYMTERAATDLHCPANQVALHEWQNQIVARGCGDTVNYTRMCSSMTEHCIRKTSMTNGEMVDLVNQQLGF